jgi:hypothetical protein
MWQPKLRLGYNADGSAFMRLMLLNLVLLSALALAVVRTQLTLRQHSAVEASVRAYAAAVTNSDLQGALVEIAPEQRDRWRGFVNSQLGNVYEVRGIAVRSPSVFARALTGDAFEPFEVTAMLDVDRGSPDDFYQPTTRVPVEVQGGQAYLGAPLLSTP